MVDCNRYTREVLEKRKKEKENEEDMRDRMDPIFYYQYTILKKELDAINMELKTGMALMALAEKGFKIL